MAKKDRETLLAKYEFHFLRDKEEIKDKRNEKYIRNLGDILYRSEYINIASRNVTEIPRIPGTNEKVESKKERREKKEKEKYTSPRWVSSRKIPNPNILSLY